MNAEGESPAPETSQPPTTDGQSPRAPQPSTAQPAADGPVREIVPHDPWSHRRGEPRVFAFLWTIFLFAATAATFLAALSTGSATPDVMRPATRALLAITAAGIVLLWPMVRLSQRADPHPVGGVVQDLVVVLIPSQAVVWPQWLAWLGRWPLEAIAAISAILAAWAIVTGGLLANAQLSHLSHERRQQADVSPRGWNAAGWMAVFVAAAIGGTLAPLLAGSATVSITGQPQEPVRISWMFSAVTAVYEVLRDRSWTGTPAAVSHEHWIAIAVTAGAGLLLWAMAGVRSRGRKAYGSLH